MKEVAIIAERICKARDRDVNDARAMLRQVDHDHGRDVALAVVEQMKVLSQRRYQEVMRVFENLPRDITFEEALRIKRARGDKCALGWTKQGNGYVKMVSRET
jgi:hypothetical protein